jgi:hypothetical protein
VEAVMSDSEVATEVVERMTANPVEKNWAQVVSIGDLFTLMLKLMAATVPIIIVLLFMAPFIIVGVREFFAGFYGTYR